MLCLGEHRVAGDRLFHRNFHLQDNPTLGQGIAQLFPARPCALSQSGRDISKQSAVSMGWGAPIGWRCLDRCTNLSRGMPAPPRIVEHRSCKGDEISLAAGDDVFRLPSLSDQTNRYRGNLRTFLDALRERKLIARTDFDLLQWRYTAR